MNYYRFAFYPTKKARKMSKEKSQNATMFTKSKVDELFNLVKTQNGIIICCGKFRISTKTFKTYKQADDYIAQKPYEILINVAVLMTNLNSKDNETERTEQENRQDK